MIPNSSPDRSLGNRMKLRAMEGMVDFNAMRYLYDLTTRNPKLLKRSVASAL